MMATVQRWTMLALACTGCALSTPIGDLPEAATAGGSGTGSTGASTETAQTEPDVTSIVSDSNASVSSGETEPVGPGPQRAFSLRWGDVPDPETTGMSDVADTGTIDPDAILVVVTTGNVTCTDPFGQLPCGGAWNLGFTLYPEHQMPGVYALTDLDASGMSTTEDPVDCGFGAGSIEGTVEILVVDAQRVTGRIMDATDLIGFDPNVEFDAPRCP